MEEVLTFVQPGDEGIFAKRTLPKILCCMCGVQIDSNPANMCVNCLRTRVDITEGIPKQLTLQQCRGCSRYVRPPWVSCALESKELLAICLKKINGLSKVKLVDAGFIWTEPHSRHIKVKLTIQKDVLNGVKLQQVFAVDFNVVNQQCDACQRSYTDHHWRAQVQVRQRIGHKKTFYLLEQLILRHNAHEKCSGVEQVPSGVDFNFIERSHAMKFIDFLASVVPTRAKAAKQLISEDIHTAVKNYKFTYAVEIVPLCRDDLCVVPSRLAATLGNINPLSLVFRVSSLVFLVDPRTLQVAEMNSEKYWREQHRAICSTNQLIEFTVLDVTPVTVAPLTGAALRRKQGKRAARQLFGASGGTVTSSSGGTGGSTSSKTGKKRSAGVMEGDEDGHSVVGASSVGPGSTHAGGFTSAVSLAGGSVHFNGASSVASTVTGGPKGKLLLADAEVVRTRDLGTSDERFIVRTHLGNILRAGDSVLGYDLTGAVFNEADGESHATGGKNRTKGTGGRGGDVNMPDIVLVRKIYKKEEKMTAARDAATAARASAPAPGASGKASRKGGVSFGDDTMEGDESVSGQTKKASKPRVWKLKRLEDVGVPVKRSDIVRAGDEERAAEEYESFLQDLEADPAMRKSINLYKNEEALKAAAEAKAAQEAARKERLRAKVASMSGVAAEDDDDDDEDDEDGDHGEVGLEELLDEMAIGDASVAEGEAGGWGGAPSAIEPGFEHSVSEGEGAYEDGGLSLTAHGRAQMGDVAEAAEGEEDESDL